MLPVILCQLPSPVYSILSVVAELVLGKWDCANTYLSYPPNVLISILLRETQILIQPESHIVAVESVRGETQVQQVLLKRCGDGGFTGRGKACEPDCEAGLLAEFVALAAREGRVPCDVAGKGRSGLAISARTFFVWRGVGV